MLVSHTLLVIQEHRLIALNIQYQCQVISYLILSYLILSYLILSYLIISYLISSHLISSHLILSYLILSYLILSYPDNPDKDKTYFNILPVAAGGEQGGPFETSLTKTYPGLKWVYMFDKTWAASESSEKTMQIMYVYVGNRIILLTDWYGVT
jgi:hypothetical protein